MFLLNAPQKRSSLASLIHWAIFFLIVQGFSVELRKLLWIESENVID